MSETGNNLRQIAQVLKSNGTDGELVIGFRDIAPEDVNTEEPVFIDFDGLPVPFFIESLSKRGVNKALVHITDVTTFEDAEELVGKAVYADRSSLDEDFDGDDFSMLIGWTLFRPVPGSVTDDEMDIEEVGEICDFLDIPNNPCIEVDTKNGAATIPLHEDLILSVNPENQEIVIDIPDGLV